MRILIIEDDSDLAANIYDYLEAKGHSADAAGDGVTGLHLAITQDYDVIIMDINMPGMDGLTACRKLRQEAGKQTPVLMLTAKDTLDDKLAGFDSGADDYLVKPFALQELLARLTALGKRGKGESDQQLLQVADLCFNPNTLEVKRAGQPVTVTPTGLKILQLLMRNSPNVVTRRQIEEALWRDSPPDSDSLRAHMHTLRGAVDRPFGTALIHTIHGIGFKLTPPAEADDAI
ncbi:XRE family transcriptional regulator [Candidatus Tenderia electrophaga]|jgi:DNA-binding response OmpR family regulator|uniref:XRE family transcriptional regulator n=1 Tax=Candidatus Tenderia electrophaga TaxID=1748243 RepID=A0A0S2TBH6_9GAMM|nr:XRE family transcriptional regulator [Candidatus Tenderia electrophaga]